MNKTKEFIDEKMLKDLKELIDKIDPNKKVFAEVDKNIEEVKQLKKKKNI